MQHFLLEKIISINCFRYNSNNYFKYPLQTNSKTWEVYIY